MPDVIDVHGVRWTVRRRLWPFRYSPLRGTTMSGDTVYGLIQLAVALPLLLVWPFWAAGRLFGGSWPIEVANQGKRVHSERVRGWAASARRVDEIAAGLRDGRGVS